MKRLKQRYFTVSFKNLNAQTTHGMQSHATRFLWVAICTPHSYNSVKLSVLEQAKRINLIESHVPKKRKVYFSPKMVSNIQLKGSLNFFDLPPLLPTHAKTRSFSNFSGGSWLRNIPHSQEWASEICVRDLRQRCSG